MNFKTNKLFSKSIALVAVFFISSMAFAQETVAVGSFDFDTEVIDYGTIKQNSNGSRVFKFKNTGTAPIIISNVKGSCGCTVPTKPEKAILPGETGEIGVKYATNRVGGFSKTITITSNASEAKKVIRIKGIVLKDKSLAVSN